MKFYDEPAECWLCGKNGMKDPLDKHHIFGGAYRKKSEKYGLTVPLCHKECHQFGKYAAHQNAETMRRLHEYGQRKAMEEQGWTVQEFALEFGRNYLNVGPDDWDLTIEEIDGRRVSPAHTEKGGEPRTQTTMRFKVLNTASLPF